MAPRDFVARVSVWQRPVGVSDGIVIVVIPTYPAL